MDTEKIIKEEIIKAFQNDTSEEHLALILNLNKSIISGVVHECTEISEIFHEDEALFRSIVQCCFQLSKLGLTMNITPLC